MQCNIQRHLSEYQGLSQKQKNLHWPMIMKILLLIQKSLSKERSRRASVVCSKYIWRVWSATSRKFDHFYSRLSLETVFPALKLKQNCLNCKHIFSLKLDNLILNMVPSLSPITIPCLKDYPYNLSFPTL